MKTVVIWDWDNTLANTKQAVKAGIEDVANHFHLPPITEDDLKNVMTVHRGEFWQRSFGSNLMDGINYYIQVYPLYAHLVTLFEDTVSMLDYIRSQGIPQIILSNKAHQNLIKEVCSTKVERYFEKIVGSDEVHGGKPDYRFAEYALQGMDYDRIIFIGDGLSDMQMASVLGAISICVGHHVPYDVPVDYRCKTIKEVLPVLKMVLEA
ncbi:MAG: HAD-IA family hydrolase [Alphaproteobacteria bacterium]|nr:HAD-IA family hydrolase [Alphaproteobacteria bacterium]